MIGSPCKDCPDRTPATEDRPSCHSGCEKYKAFRKELEAVNKARFDEMTGRYNGNPQKLNALHKKMRWK